MQERVNEKTVAVAVQATKMSGRMIARIGEMYLRHVREKRRDNKLTKSRDPSTYKHNRAGKLITHLHKPCDKREDPGTGSYGYPC